MLRVAGRGIVWVQSPVVLADDSEPQPDLVVLRRRPVPYKDADATATDAALLIEVAELSLRYDRSTKLALYAEASIDFGFFEVGVDYSYDLFSWEGLSWSDQLFSKTGSF